MHVEFDRTETFSTSAGTEIVCRYIGQGERLFVFHGGSGSYRHWVRNLPALAAHFSLCVPDLPGFGDSGDVPPDISLDEYLDLVEQWVDAVAPAGEPFHLMGFSYGGMVGAGIAARLAQRVRRLTLLAPGGMGKPAGPSPSVKLAKVRPGMDEAQIRSVHRSNLEMMMFADPARIDEETVTLHRENIERARFRNWGLSWTDSVVGYLAGMTFPVQLMLGEKDAVARPTVANRVERCLAAKPDLEVRIIPGAGHWAQYESPEEVNGHLIRFHTAAG